MAMTLKAVLSLDNKGFVAGVSESSKQVDRLGDNAKTAGGKMTTAADAGNKAFGGLKNAIGLAVAALGAAEVAQGIGEVIRYNAEINLLTQSLHVSRDAMQVWSMMGKSAGVDIADIFKDVNEKFGEFAATGGGEAADVVKQLKLNIDDLIAMSPDQQILAVAEAMSKVKDMSSGQKTFLLESLGNDLSKILPMLDDNAAKLRELDRLTRSSGAIITDEQNANLSEAKENLDKLTLVMRGAGNAAADVGSQIVNAFAGDAMDAVSGLDDAIYVIANDATMVADSWSTAMDMLGVDGAEAFDVVGKSFDGLMDKVRIGYTYWPVWAASAYTAIDEQGRAYIASVQAQFNALRSTIRGVSADVIEDAGSAFDWISNIARKGGNALFGGNALPSTGTFAPYVTALRDAEVHYDKSSSQLANLSVKAGDAAKAAIAGAGAYQQQAEQQRILNLEFSEAERQFAALGSGLDATGTKAQTFRVNQEAVNKALNDTEGEAKKAASGLKELSAPWLSGSVAFKSEIEAAASRFGVDANLVKSVIQQETGYLKEAQKQLKAASPAGALGVMQLMPNTAKETAKAIGLTNYNLFKAADNITLGTAYLSQQLAKYNGDISKVAAAYNAGPGAVDKYAGIPPYKETQGYVKSVLGYYAELEKGVDNSGKAQIKSILEVEKTRLEAAKKIADEKAQLQAEVEKAKTSTIGGYAIDLRVQRVGADDRTEMVALKSAAALAQLQRQAEATRMEAVLGKEAFRQWQLVNEEGFIPSVAAAQVALEQQATQAQSFRQVWDGVMSQTEDALLTTALGGKGAWGELVSYMIKEATRLYAIQPIMQSLFGNGSTTSGGGGGFIGDFLGSLFGGGRASGGSTRRGTINEVNENGIPELVHAGGRSFLMNTADGYVEPLRVGGNMAGIGAGAANITVQNRIEIINKADTNVTTKESSNPDGSMSLQILIEPLESMISDRARRGMGLANTFRTVG